MPAKKRTKKQKQLTQKKRVSQPKLKAISLDKSDNLIHFDDGNDVISAYKPIAKIIPKQNGINSNGQMTTSLHFNTTTVQDKKGQLYILDCNNPYTSNYFTESCKLKNYSMDTRIIKEHKSDYDQIKINY